MNDRLFQQAVTHHSAGHHTEAIALYRRILAENPRHAGACCNLGSLLRRNRQNEEGIVLLWQAVSADPQHADAWNNLGNALQEAGNRIEALGCYRRAVAARTDFFEARLSLGSLLITLERYGEAEEILQQIAGDRQALILLGNLYELQGRLSEATACYQRIAGHTPDDVPVLQCLGNVLLLQGKAEKAVAIYRQAVKRAPGDFRLISSLLLALQYHPALDDRTLLHEAQRLGALFPSEQPPLRRYPEQTRKTLRVGYLSGDLCSHPVGMFLKEVIRLHTPDKVTVFCYSNGTPRHDAVTAEIQSCCTWREIGQSSDEDVRTLIAQDRIDVLVDLAGHTARNRMSLFARRAAPVQVAWLGYFATTGIPAMDFVVMDHHHVPAGGEQLFHEQVLYLPDCRFCFAPPTFAPLPAWSPCKRNGYIAFGSFNSTAKLNEQVLQVWAAILQAVPQSRLILKWVTFSDQQLCADISRFFRHHGITDDRLELRGRSSHAEMLAQYAALDIALDPFPFSGGMTSCEALWMGVPVVTLPGTRPVSRQTLSFLSAIGIQELAATDEADYIRLAVELAGQPDRLQELRSGLRQKLAASPLCDAGTFVKALEAVLSQSHLTAPLPKEKGIPNSLS